MSLAALALVLAAAPAVQGPVAVLPFKNLGADPGLGWLELGMAETLIADLKRARRLEVVERSAVEKALAQAVKSTQGGDDGQALQVGKLVSAKTVVLGSFQRSGGQVRIAARFVAVETGVVTEAARATGPLESAFTVQDQLVEKLLGAPLAEKPRRGKPARAVKAFEYWGKSLAARDEAEQKALLVASVKEDPQFSYAVEHLAALEARLRGYAEISSAKLAAHEQALLKTIESRRPAAERQQAAEQLLSGLGSARRFHTLAALAPRVAGASGLDVRESAAFGSFAALMGLHRYDDALAAGERFLKDFPASPRFKEVEGRMREVLAARKKRAARMAEYQADLAEKKQDCKGALECDYAPCICARWTSMVGPLMLESCSKFLRAHEGAKGEDAAEKIAAARFFVALSLVELGEWAKAKEMIARLEAGPDRGWDDELEALRAGWPADEAP